MEKIKLKIHRATPPQTNSGHLVYKIKIQLKNSPYPIWRVVLLDGDWTIAQMEHVLLDAMGWEFEHLYNFSINGITFADPTMAECFMGEIDAHDHTIKEVMRLKSKGRLTYDFGDSWEHSVTVLDIMADDKSELPFCIRAKGACPPEDCGGVYGLRNILDLMDTPNDSEYDNMVEWLGDRFDPSDVNIDMINIRLEM